MQKTTIVVVGTFREGYEQFFAEYSRKVRTFLDARGAIVVRRQRVERVLHGNAAPDLVMLIDFPEKETAETVFLEPEYLVLIPLREKVFSDFQMFLAAYGEV
jgi:uncharacterized protein (DUF1330 family)